MINTEIDNQNPDNAIILDNREWCYLVIQHINKPSKEDLWGIVKYLFSKCGIACDPWIYKSPYFCESHEFGVFWETWIEIYESYEFLANIDYGEYAMNCEVFLQSDIHYLDALEYEQ